jgi:hypothetical protein
MHNAWIVYVNGTPAALVTGADKEATEMRMRELYLGKDAMVEARDILEVEDKVAFVMIGLALVNGISAVAQLLSQQSKPLMFGRHH